MMRKLFFKAAAAVALWAAALVAPQSAQAMTFGDPAGLRAAIDATSVVESVPCRLVRRCGPRGCGWRRVCWGGPPVYYGPPAYYYGPRPYWGRRGPYWRRYW
jgi:hypothetical protein